MKRRILNIPNHSRWASQLLSRIQFYFEICKSFPGILALLYEMLALSQFTKWPDSLQQCKQQGALWPGALGPHRPSQKWSFIQLLTKQTFIKHLPPAHHVLLPDLLSAKLHDGMHFPRTKEEGIRQKNKRTTTKQTNKKAFRDSYQTPLLLSHCLGSYSDKGKGGGGDTTLSPGSVCCVRWLVRLPQCCLRK